MASADEVAVTALDLVEKPILFSAPMVRAILDGSKTQTRRIVTARYPISHIGPSGTKDDPSEWGCFFDGPDQHGYMVLGRGWDERHDHGRISIPCPYGEPGDRLWVRETWSIASGNGRRVVYRADLGTDRWPPSVLVPSDDAKVWKPSIHMKRADARIVLEVTEVRVERVTAISQEDARAEGVGVLPAGTDDDGAHYDASDHRTAFRALWDSIHGARAPWSSNPWVWAITFRRAQP